MTFNRTLDITNVRNYNNACLQYGIYNYVHQIKIIPQQSLPSVCITDIPCSYVHNSLSNIKFSYLLVTMLNTVPLEVLHNDELNKQTLCNLYSNLLTQCCISHRYTR